MNSLFQWHPGTFYRLSSFGSSQFRWYLWFQSKLCYFDRMLTRFWICSKESHRPCADHSSISSLAFICFCFQNSAPRIFQSLESLIYCWIVNLIHFNLEFVEQSNLISSSFFSGLFSLVWSYNLELWNIKLIFCFLGAFFVLKYFLTIILD